MKKINSKIIDPVDYQNRCLALLKQLNPEKEISIIENRFHEMIEQPNYKCFGLFLDEELIGISSVWTSVRIHCGKRLELDNVIIDTKIQSKGYGKFFIDSIKNWSQENNYQSIGLNTYTQNHRSHKFYYNQGYQILGYNFELYL